MRHLFALHPATEFENYRASHIGAGEQYHRRFARHPGRAMMWALEQELITRVVSSRRPARILDFACGTGRISSYVERTFPEPEIHGIDVSESMLEVARKSAGRTLYRRVDSRGAVEVFGEKSFDMVLAFRFFANAEPPLRRTVAEDLVRLLAEDGTLVINNHRNFWSTSYVTRRLRGEKPFGALNGDIEKLFREQGLRVEQKLSLGVWPQGDVRAMLLPWRIVRAVERANLTSLASHHTLGYNTVWVLARR